MTFSPHAHGSCCHRDKEKILQGSEGGQVILGTQSAGGRG